ncbi:hypothetical protein BDZ89DRAFT_260148 [Hymenopellis radicata]|nr:hypothetical protein BDZ89DRAFT_260148 [Hymenopellis radicata]
MPYSVRIFETNRTPLFSGTRSSNSARYASSSRYRTSGRSAQNFLLFPRGLIQRLSPTTYRDQYNGLSTVRDPNFIQLCHSGGRLVTHANHHLWRLSPCSLSYQLRSRLPRRPACAKRDPARGVVPASVSNLAWLLLHGFLRFGARSHPIFRRRDRPETSSIIGRQVVALLPNLLQRLTPYCRSPENHVSGCPAMLRVRPDKPLAFFFCGAWRSLRTFFAIRTTTIGHEFDTLLSI